MKQDQFAITGISLTHDQAIQLKIDCINAIDNYGIENFEVKKIEIQVPNESEDEPIDCFITCETFCEYEPCAAPFEPTLLDRSVHLKLQLFNRSGDPVNWNVLGERRIGEHGLFYTHLPIDIEEEIIKHFTV